MAEAGGTGKNTAAGNLAVEIARVIERGVRDSQALVSPCLFLFSTFFYWLPMYVICGVQIEERPPTHPKGNSMATRYSVLK